AGIDMPLRLIPVPENAGRFHDILDTQLSPGQILRILLSKYPDLLAVDNNTVAVDAHFALELAVHRIILQQMGQCRSVSQVVDGHKFEIGVVDPSSEDQPADTAKTIDTYSDCHLHFLLAF